MYITLFSNYLKERAFDMVIDIQDLEKSEFDTFQEIVYQRTEDYEYWGDNTIKIKNVPLESSILTLYREQYKCICKIISNGNEKNDYMFTYHKLFEYMKLLNYKTVSLSLMQYKNVLGDAFDINEIFNELIKSSYLYGIDIWVYVEEACLDKYQMQIKKEFGKKLNINKDCVIYGKSCRYENNNFNNLYQFDKNKMDQYIEEHKKSPNKFRDLLHYYLRKSKYANCTEADIANIANIHESTFSKILNGENKNELKRNCVLSLGIVLGLDKKELESFMKTAGYIFPKKDGSIEARTDWCVIYLIETYNTRKVAMINDVLRRKNLYVLGNKNPNKIPKNSKGFLGEQFEASDLASYLASYLKKENLDETGNVLCWLREVDCMRMLNFVAYGYGGGKPSIGFVE